MIQVTLAKNCFEPESWTHHEVEDFCAFLQQEFSTFPETALIYHRSVDEANNVTPNSPEQIDRLQTLPGPFYVIVYPEGPLALVYALIIALVVAVTIVALSPVPKPNTQNSTPGSPNNNLADRQNQARLFGRIPDIYGTVRSTPDLLMVPYTVYENNIEVEHCYMCVGRGFFTVLDVRDDTTSIATIDGARAIVYNPGSSPNFTGTYSPPAGAISDAHGINYQAGNGVGAIEIWDIARNSGINGQTLPAPDGGGGGGGGDGVNEYRSSGMAIRPMKVGSVYSIQSFNITLYDLTKLNLSDGDTVPFYMIAIDGDHDNLDMSGQFLVSGTPTATNIVLSNATVVNPNWYNADVLIGSYTGARVVGGGGGGDGGDTTVPIIWLLYAGMTQVWVNVVAENGLYTIDSSNNVAALTINLKVTLSPINMDGTPRGSDQVYTSSIVGGVDKNGVGVTFKIPLTDPGPTAVTIERTSDTPDEPQYTDTVQWKDLYAVAPVTETQFGDVTTVYTVTQATKGALSVKERKLNMLVQRMLPQHTTGNSFGSLVATNDYATAMCAISTDAALGNRQITEIDVAGLYTNLSAINGYFGTSQASEFCTTFDQDNLSYEEIMQSVASCVFCGVHRQGSTIITSFEQATDDSVMLFGHRNKVPGSETRTITFGYINDYDCVQYTYSDPTDDSRVVIYAPSQGVNPKKIDSVGVRNFAQAYFHCWREWQKLIYGNTQTEFEALQEACVLQMADRILVADNTRTGTQDGEIVAQNMLQIQLSQPYVMEEGKSYAIFLQGVNGDVDNIPIHAGSSQFVVVLTRAPVVTLSLDENASVRTLYWIVETTDIRPQAFLLTARAPASAFTENVTAINYDARYYLKDLDYINGTLPSDPNGRKGTEPVQPGGGDTV